MRKSKFNSLKEKALDLRKNGNTYGEIRKALKTEIPKSTLSNWCKDIFLLPEQSQKIEESASNNIHRGRLVALAMMKKKRNMYLLEVENRVRHLPSLLKENKDIAKIVLATLYLGEGAKTRSSLMLGDSDPSVIVLFLHLLRRSYSIDEKKFRCTLQCRDDQDIKKLEEYWANITKIPLSQFYKARVDARTIGQKSKKPDYKGVCRIDYFSADIFIEIMKIIELIHAKGM